MVFIKTTVLKLEVENTPSGLVNLVQNPSGDLGGWGWITPVAGSAMKGSGGANLEYSAAASVPNWFTTENLPVAAGQYVSARWVAPTVGANYRVRLEWVDSAGVLISSSTQSIYYASSATPVVYAATVAPALTAFVRLRFDHYSNTSGGNPTAGSKVLLNGVTVAKAATSAALSGLGYLDPATYTNILGPTHSISIKRNELNVGILAAEVLDATIDPSQSTLVRPGKRVRLMALDNATATWTPLFTGKIVGANTTYDLKRTDAKKARITLTVLDAVSVLSQISRPEGVATIPELPYILEGCGVPWNVDGSGNQVPTATVVTTDENASALDQVAITRDSESGYAWVDRKGILQASSSRTDSRFGAPITTINEDDYSDLAIDYDTDRCINSVKVNLRRVNLANGQTVEVVYGPYVDQASIDQWGPHAKEFTVQGITDSDVAAAAYAAPILTENATPAVRVNSARIPIRAAADLVATRGLLDLYDQVTVANTNAGISDIMRITGVEHTITPDRWTLDLDFAADEHVAPPSLPIRRGTDLAASSVAGDGTGWLRPGASGGPTWGTGWGDFNALYELVAMKRVGTTVKVRGSAMRSSGSSTTILTLPAGCKPSKHTNRWSRANTTAGDVFIDSGTGAVILSTGTYANSQQYVLDIEFDTDQP